MKKVFSLRAPGKTDARVVDAVKHDVRKYVKRERRKTIPEGFTEWDFDCRVGASATTAATTTLKDLSAGIDSIAAAEGTEVYIEILARAALRAPRGAAAASLSTEVRATSPRLA